MGEDLSEASPEVVETALEKNGEARDEWPEEAEVDSGDPEEPNGAHEAAGGLAAEAAAEDDDDGPPSDVHYAKIFAYDQEENVWQDRGSGEFHVRNDRMCLVNTDNGSPPKIVFDTRMRENSAFSLENDSVVVWTDKEAGAEFALSFQTPEGARFLMEHPAGGALPLPSVGNLDELINHMLHAGQKPPPMRGSTLRSVLDEKWVKELGDLIDQMSDLEDTETLERLFKLVKGVILLDPRQVCERLLADDLYLNIFTALEHDPGIRKEVRYEHRKFFTETAKRVSVVAFDEELRTQVDLAYRYWYLRDTCIPRWLDDNQMAAFTNGLGEIWGEIIRRVTEPAFVDALAEAQEAATRPEATPMERRCAARLLQQAFHMSKTYLDMRTLVFESWVPRGCYSWVLAHLEYGDPEARDAAIDVLIHVCMHNVLPFRCYIQKQPEKLHVLVTLLLSDEPSLRSQAGDVLRMVLDNPSNAPEDQACVEAWYTEEFAYVVAALGPPPPGGGPADPAVQQAVLDLLACCVQHQAHAHQAFTRRRAIHIAAELLGSPSKLVVLGVVRLFRHMVRSGNVFLPFIIKYGFLWKFGRLLAPSRPATGPGGDDVLTGAVLEFLAGITGLSDAGVGKATKPVRELVEHLCDPRSELEQYRNNFIVNRIFELKEEMEKAERDEEDRGPDRDLSSTGQREGGNSPRRSDKFREELREEAFFDEDDDEEEDRSPPRSDTRSNEEVRFSPEVEESEPAEPPEPPGEVAAPADAAGVSGVDDDDDDPIEAPENPRKKTRTE